MVTSILVRPTASVLVVEVKVEAMGSYEKLMSYPRTHYCSNFRQAKVFKTVHLRVTDKRYQQLFPVMHLN
jgi:hypothetical protein